MLPGSILDARPDVPEWLRELRVIDTDSHYSEPADLWTRHAPPEFKDRLPHIAEVGGKRKWVFDGIPIADARATAIILPDGSVAPGMRLFDLTNEQVHPACYDWRARLDMMDRMGVFAQILYPNVSGHGNHRAISVKDASLRALSASVYNDAMAEIQHASGGRLFPIAHIPWWDMERAIAELRRIGNIGLRGFAMCSDPQDAGLPDLAECYWDPFWETCCELRLPVSFHIAASDSSTKSWFGDSPWPSHPNEVKLMIGSIMAFLSNARIIANLILGGVLERFPDLKIVSVESGIGWIPFLLEAMDYAIRGAERPFLRLKPSEYFHRQVYACFWFEKAAPLTQLGAIGVRNALFQTDIPHSNCLYPDTTAHVIDVFENVPADARRRLLQDNAAELYRIEIPDVAAKAP